MVLSTVVQQKYFFVLVSSSSGDSHVGRLDIYQQKTRKLRKTGSWGNGHSHLLTVFMTSQVARHEMAALAASFFLSFFFSISFPEFNFNKLDHKVSGKCLGLFFLFHFLSARPAVPVCLGSPLNYQSQTPKKALQTILFTQCNREIIYFIILSSQSNFSRSACTTVPLTANPLLKVNGLSVSPGCWS